MLAGGMVIAAPAMVPEAAAAGALYVSAENAQFDNLFGGPMVVEVIVKDVNRSQTNENAGEPTVLVDNQRLRLAQGLDGNWYGYFADKSDVATVAADTADQLKWGDENEPKGGGPATLASGDADRITTFDDTTYSNLNAGDGVIDNPPGLSNWNNTANAKCDQCGQIGIQVADWPFLQTFDFIQGDFDVILEQAGTDEVVTLDHNNADLDDYSGLTLDRNSATQSSEVHMFIVDQQLNIDPTDEDKVIFKVAINGTSTGSTVAWTNGTFNYSLTDAVLAVNATGYSAAGAGHGFGDNGILLINFNTTGSSELVLEKNTTLDDTITEYSYSSDQYYRYIVFVEDADNTGTFSNVDDDDNSNLDVTSTALRGTTATFDYNDSAQSFIVANDFGTIDMDESSVGDEWNSGETLTVILVDQDLNKNTLSDEDMALRTHNGTIPALKIGSPIMLDTNSTIGGDTMSVNAFNGIGSLNSATEVSAARHTNVTVEYANTKVSDFRTAATAADFIFVNYNVTQVMASVSGISLAFDDSSVLIAVESTTEEAGLLRLTGDLTAEGSATVEAGKLNLNFTGATGAGNGVAYSPAVGETLYVDIFTFGDKTGYDRQNNAIYRLLLEETGDNTATFIGDVEFVMLNQINTNVATTFSAITTESDSIDIIVHEDLTDEDSPRINYLDLGSDGVSTQIADQVEAPSHSGVVTFDSGNYKIADTVVVSLDDQDLNTDSELIDVYITSSSDHVGENASDSTSYVLDITFNDVLWKAGVVGTTAGSPDNGLKASGFTLVETDIASGLFTGTFQVPSTYWNDDTSVTETTPVTTTGTDIEVNYNDHRDASGETIEVGAGASINANTGSVEFDRTVYPVPWGNVTAAGVAGE